MSEVNTQVEDAILKGTAKDGVILEDSNSIMVTIPDEDSAEREASIKEKMEAISTQIKADYAAEQQAEADRIAEEQRQQVLEKEAQIAAEREAAKTQTEGETAAEDNKIVLPPVMRFTDLINPYNNDITEEQIERICGSIPYSSRLTPEMVEAEIAKEAQEEVLNQLNTIIEEKQAEKAVQQSEKSIWQKIKEAIKGFFTTQN